MLYADGLCFTIFVELKRRVSDFCHLTQFFLCHSIKQPQFLYIELYHVISPSFSKRAFSKTSILRISVSGLFS